jgi:MoaA/NifB/PqqE/SkfB family radical SAM enzyme
MDDTAMITKSPTFCPAPWTSLNIDQAGEVSPCFHCVDMIGNVKKNTIQEVITGPVVTGMKQAMARGEWATGCSWCKQLEETTGVSGRTVKQTSNETLEAIDTDPEFFKLEHLVVNWSNLCNLACVYCNPETSTAWQSIKKIPINHVKNEHADLIKLARTQGHNIQGLSLGGGEPLLQRGLEQFLDYINPATVRVMITTNLSMDLNTNAIYQRLRTWPNVEWMISFDNADQDKFEYVRHGASWVQFVKNIQIMKKDGLNIKAHPAYSVYCALDLLEYYDFCDQENIGIYWCELTHPLDLDIRRQSQKLRQLAIEEIDRVVAKYQTRVDLNTNVLERYRKQLDNTSYLNHQDSILDLLEWHKNIETTLKKTTRFVDLWPNIAKNSMKTNNTLWHFGTKSAGQTLKWMPTDTEENFQQLMQHKEYQEYFRNKGWLEPDAITYRINSEGFRSEEFDPQASSMVSLGCSYTIGLGLPEKSTWSHLVSQALGLKNYNLAWGGTSADTCFMLANHWLPILRPKLVVMAAPPKHRFDLITENPGHNHDTYMPSSEIGGADTDNFIKTWFLHDRNADLNNARNRLAVEGLCARLGIQCLTYNAHDWFAKSREEVEYARDRMHAGPLGHQLFAERIINDFTTAK